MPAHIDVGDVIRRVLRIYVEQAPVLMPVAAVVFVFTGVLSTVLVNASSGLRLLALLISLSKAGWLRLRPGPAPPAIDLGTPEGP